MTISCDIIICNNFNGSMTCWRLKLDYLFNTIPNSFTIFNIFKEIITETKQNKTKQNKKYNFFKKHNYIYKKDKTDSYMKQLRFSFGLTSLK